MLPEPHPIRRDVDQAVTRARQSWRHWRGESQVAETALRVPSLLPVWLGIMPLIPASFAALIAGRLGAFAADALAFAVFAGAAVLTRRAYRPRAFIRRRRFSRTWHLPLLNLAGALVGMATAVTAIPGAGYPVLVGLTFALVATLGYYLAYGVEPWSLGARLDAQDRESRLVAEALAEAESRLIQIEESSLDLGNQELRARLSRIAALGREILGRIAERPSDLRRARRFLTVFLEGAEQVSSGYVRTHPHADSAELEQRFRSVLITIEEQFSRQRQRLTEADVMDLDVRIEVLQKQLEQEGIS